MGSGMSRAFDPEADGVSIRFSGVRGRDMPEEFVDVSQPWPEEHREEMSPSRACGSRDEDLEDFPEEPPRDEPPLDEQAAPPPPPAVTMPPRATFPSGSNFPRPRPAGHGRGGEVAAGGAAPLLKGGDVLTEPSGC